ncbi:unnamed protein product [Adineta steineri]|uniref:ADP ribosyltransferase domain-containing protein n=3 Tax=Adineta steineri TaxID=433720 RepID=A0A814F9H1_9BILA|nr:unnamed protein product [Adineta steineri]
MGNKNNKQIENNSPSPSTNSSLSRRLLNNESIDQFILIWLDHNALENSLDSLRTKTLIHELNNNHCLFFNDVNLFLVEIERLRNNDKQILLIVSGKFADKIPLHNIDIIATIIIFCGNSNRYKHLKETNRKIIDICTEHETLKNSIQRELPSLKLNLFTDRKSNSLRSLIASQNTGIDDSAYYFYMLFTDFLRQIPQRKEAKDTMLDKCKICYRNNKTKLKCIELFGNTYTQDKAIDWYTEDSFVYRLVNLAFRTEDITLWYLFRYYITDLCKQLEDTHKQQNCQSVLKLYRGQTHLPKEELENLKSNKGNLISTNGFFSTSKDIDLASWFIQGATDTEDYRVALFEITVDAKNLKNSIFVDIDQYKGISGECEVLFNIGSVFEIESVNYDNNFKAWKIKMKATDEGTDSIKERIQQMKKKFQNGNINLLFGRLLLDMNQYIKAESYFQMMIDVSPSSHPDLPLFYDCLGELNMHTTNWKEAFKNYHSSYEIKKKNIHSDHRNIGVTLNGLGNYYKAIRNNNEALKCYSKVLMFKNDPYNKAITLLNMSAIYVKEKDYDKAYDLCIEARDIIQETSSNASIALIQCYSVMSSIYLAQKDYDKAEDFSTAAYELSGKTLFIDDRHRIVCIKAFANLSCQKNKKQEAIDFCFTCLSFYEQYLTYNHVNVAYLFMIIAELYEDNEIERIEFLEKALNILQENIHLHYDTTANCLKLIGQYYQKQNSLELAMGFYIKCQEIQKKIYFEDHSTLKEIQCLINTIDY